MVESFSKNRLDRPYSGSYNLAGRKSMIGQIKKSDPKTLHKKSTITIQKLDLLLVEMKKR